MMTKKERQAFEAALRAARVAGALRWTSPVAPDIPPPQHGNLTKGWLFNEHSSRVSRACSSAVHHNPWTDTETNTQGARALYSTELLALKAMRHAKEKRFAEELADLDERIEGASNVPAR